MTRNELISRSIEKLKQGKSMVAIKAFLDHQQVDQQMQTEIFNKLREVEQEMKVSVEKQLWWKKLSKGLYVFCVGIILVVASTILFLAMNGYGATNAIEHNATILDHTRYYFSPLNIILWVLGIIAIICGIILMFIGAYKKAKQVTKSKPTEF